MAAWHDCFRIFSAATNSATSGTAFSTSVVGTQTRYVRLAVPAQPDSTGGVYYAIGEAPVAASTTGTFLPPGWVEVVRITPGQKVSFVARGLTTDLNVSQLTD